MLTAQQLQFWKPYIDALPDPSQFSIDNSTSIGVVRSPYYTGWDASQAQGGEGTRTVVISRIKFVDDILKKSDVDKSDMLRIIMNVSSTHYDMWLLQLLPRYAHNLTDDEHWNLIIDTWQMQKIDNPQSIQNWHAIFSLRPARSWLTSDLPYAHDEVFTVYRGGSRDGMSWSLDYSTAEWFHDRNEKLGYPSQLHERDITSQDVLFYTNGRSEQEVVLLGLASTRLSS